MLGESRNSENKGDIPDCIFCLTSADIQRDNPSTMEPIQKQGRTKSRVGYPLRFRSKAQKKRLEEAAKRVHKTLKDFLIDLGEKAAADMGREMAS